MLSYIEENSLGGRLYLVSFMLSSFVMSVLMYMHRADPVYGFILPFFIFPLEIWNLFYFSIMFTAGVIEHNRYRFPDIILYLSLFPLFTGGFRSLLSGIIFVIPILLLYFINDTLDYRVLVIGDIKVFFSIGIFLNDINLLLPFYALSFILFVPYSLFKREIVPLGPPVIFATYILKVFL